MTAPDDDDHKDRYNSYAPRGLQRRIRNTVAGMSRQSTGYSLTDFTVDALAAHVARLEELHNDGQPFPPLSGELRPGPRVR